MSIRFNSSNTQYSVQGSDSVTELKEKICKKKSLASDRMNIEYNGRWLNDDANWWQTGVFSDDNSELHLRKR